MAPCNSEHMEPTYMEIESKHLCEHIVYLLPLLNRKVPSWAKSGAEDYYGNCPKRSEAEQILISTIESMTPAQKDRYIYDGRNKNARKLADWYDNYSEKYKTKLEKKQREKDLKDKAEDILSKLREGEVEILRNYLK